MNKLIVRNTRNNNHPFDVFKVEAGRVTYLCSVEQVPPDFDGVVADLPATYLVFTGDDYYPRGGADDFKGAFNTLPEAVSFCLTTPVIGAGWLHIAVLAQNKMTILLEGRPHSITQINWQIPRN